MIGTKKHSTARTIGKAHFYPALVTLDRNSSVSFETQARTLNPQIEQAKVVDHLTSPTSLMFIGLAFAKMRTASHRSPIAK